jgi:hypothetical protein
MISTKLSLNGAVNVSSPDFGSAAKAGIDEQSLCGSPIEKAGTGQRLSVDLSNGPIANVQRSFGDAARPVRREHTLAYAVSHIAIVELLETSRCP